MYDDNAIDMSTHIEAHKQYTLSPNTVWYGNTYTIDKASNGYIINYQGSKYVFNNLEDMFKFIGEKEDKSNGNR